MPVYRQREGRSVAPSPSDKWDMLKEYGTTKLAEATIAQFTEALIRGNGFGHEAIYIKNFFSNEQFAIVEETLDQYTHNICQHVMKTYFHDVLGLEKIKETYYDEGGEVAVTYENLEYAPAQFEKVYKNAFVIFQKEGQKVCVSINKFGNREIVYRVYTAAGSDDIMMKWIEYARQHNLYKGQKITANCEFLKLKDVSWEDIILDPKTVEVVKEQVNELFDFSDYLKANNINVKRGVILAGCPGTGKTMLCKVLAKEMHTTVIYAMPSQMERTVDVRRICEMAKDLAPSMLIIEDIDFIAENRDESHNAGMVMELMNYMDGLQDFSEIVTLATTNAEDKIEDAVKNRPGRFDRIIQVPKPNAALRRRMLERFTSSFNVGEMDLDEIVKRTAKLSGAHLKHICETAAFKAIRAKSVDGNKKAIIKHEHFIEALKEIDNEQFSSFHKARNQTKKIGGFTNDENW
jgi:ATP-dependent 26S proteasome regulatory subunit